MISEINLSNQTIFNYIIVIIICIFVFRKYDIQLNFIFGIFIAFLIISYYYQIDYKEDLKNNEIFEENSSACRNKDGNWEII